MASAAVHGSDDSIRTVLEAMGLVSVVGVRTDHAVWAGFKQVMAKSLLEEAPANAWLHLSCGAGSKGPR